MRGRGTDQRSQSGEDRRHTRAPIGATLIAARLVWGRQMRVLVFKSSDALDSAFTHHSFSISGDAPQLAYQPACSLVLLN